MSFKPRRRFASQEIVKGEMTRREFQLLSATVPLLGCGMAHYSSGKIQEAKKNKKQKENKPPQNQSSQDVQAQTIKPLLDHRRGVKHSHRKGLNRKPLSPRKKSEHRFWIMGCMHFAADAEEGQNTFFKAIQDSVLMNFDYVNLLMLGDFASSKGYPSKFEGEYIASQLKFLGSKRERLLTLAGNHDADDGQEWFKKYCLYTADNKKQKDAFRNYSYRYGNVLFLMISDQNDMPFPRGRANAFPGGHPAGSISQETFDWLKHQLQSNAKSNIVICSHHMLKATTFNTDVLGGIALGPTPEASMPERHGISAGIVDGESKKLLKGLSYLRFVGAHDLEAKEGALDPVRKLLNEYPNVLWLGAHTHGSLLRGDGKPRKFVHKDENGNVFVNCSSLSQCHGKFCDPSSRVMILREGSNRFEIKAFVHANGYLGEQRTGWSTPSSFAAEMRFPFALK